MDKDPWVSTAVVCEHLNIAAGTLRYLMYSTPDDLYRPWVNVGTGARPTYGWRLVLVDDWIRALQALPVRTGRHRRAKARGRAGADVPSLRLLADDVSKGKG
ncbi:MAG: hypothetical protein ABMA64_16175 [Myxococcota bacterium]